MLLGELDQRHGAAAQEPPVQDIVRYLTSHRCYGNDPTA